MNTFLKIAMATLALALASDEAFSESHTNAVLNTTFALTAYVQENTNGPVWTVSTRKFSNSDIIGAIVTDLGLPANNFSNASLDLFSEDVVTNHHIKFIIRANGADTDVSSNIDVLIPDNTEIVNAVQAAPFGRTTNTTDLTIFEFRLGTTNASFDVQGAARLDSSSIVLNGKVLDKTPFTRRLSVDVAGSGTIDGKDAVFKGTFRTLPRKIEVQTAP